MSTPADKVVITVQGDGYSIECYAGRVHFAGQTVEYDGNHIEKSGDDFFVELPVDLAVTLHDIDLKLQDVVLALMPEAA